MLLLLMVILFSCSTSQKMSRNINREFSNSTLAGKYLVGFALYDWEKQQMILEKNADLYFTPASNTKLFTFYVGLKVYPDSIPSLRYIERGDSLIFWGTGDPSLLHTELKGTKAIEFLKKSNKKLFFASDRYKGSFFGYGWAWDDYNDYYQPEMNELPLFDNVLHLSATKEEKLKIFPLSFQSCFSQVDNSPIKKFTVQRDFLTNKFHYPNLRIPQGFSQDVPFKISTALTLTLLSDTLKKEVKVLDYPLVSNAKTIYSSKSEDVFRQMMLSSDNFIAEQLLLTYADKLGVEMSADAVINAAKQEYLTELPDAPKWLDGSGLSRSNLFTPRSVVQLLRMIYKEVGNQEKLFSMLPAGGLRGTLRNAYPKTNQPFVFAKTGTLGGVHNQSGYLLTKKGKLFLFSFMNNNYVQSTSEIRNEMVRMMTLIHNNY